HGKSEMPLEAESEGEAQLAATQNRISEQHAEPGGVDDAEPRGIGVHAMQRAEYGGDSEYGRVRAPGSQEHLKSIAAKQNLLAGGARQQDNRGEQENNPTHMTLAVGRKPGDVDGQGRKQNQRSRPHSARQPKGEVYHRRSIPLQSEIGQMPPPVNSQRDPVRRQGGHELAQRDTKKIAANPVQRRRRDARRKDIKDYVDADAEENRCWLLV